MATASPKILRVAIVQNTTVVEERLLRKRHAISIGQAAANTLVVPSAQLPSSHDLFELRSGQYHLRLTPEMTGGVKVDGGLMDFQALAAAGLAQTHPAGGLLIPLSDRSRGRVGIGDITVLFQFVSPPPPAQSLGLPASVRGGFVAAQDWPFMTTLLASLVLQVFSVAFIVTRDYPEELRTVVDLDGRFVPPVIFTPQPAEPPMRAPHVKDIAPDPEIKRPEPKQVEHTPPETPESSNEPLSAQDRQRVRQDSVIGILGSKGQDNAQIVEDILGGGADMQAALDAFGPANTGLALKDTPRDKRRSLIDTEGSLAKIGQPLHAKGPGKTVRTGTKQEQKIGKVGTRKVREDDVISTGPVDTKAIASVIRRRKNRIMNCYTRRLKARNDLAGKVEVRFMIAPSGRVQSAKVVGNSTGDGTLGKCVVNQIRRWRFPRAQASATVDYPFIFTPAR